MRDNNRVTLVQPGKGRPTLEWNFLRGDHAVIPVHNTSLLNAALYNAINVLNKEVQRVIFDRSIDSDTYLEFLSSLPANFRGDLLWIKDDKSAFLSSITRDDGRVIYSLLPVDVDFYLKVIFGIDREAPAPRPFSPSRAEHYILSLAS